MAGNRLGEPGDVYRPWAPAASMSYSDGDTGLGEAQHRTVWWQDHPVQTMV